MDKIVFPSHSHPYGLVASEPFFDLLGQDLKMPEPNDADSVKTWNLGGGFMLLDIDSFSKRFIDLAKTSTDPLLEIGTAYGISTISALENSTCPIIANDISEENLLILRKRAKMQDLHRLYLNLGCFPDDLHFSSNSLGAVLICRVAHFFTGDVIEQGLKKIYDWLIPGGKLFFVIATPFRSNLIDFIPIYEQRWQDGNPWPGYLHDYRKRADDFGYNLKDFFHVMDKRPLKRVFLDTGFEIEDLSYIDRSKKSKLSYDGREYLGAIGIKPRSTNKY